MSNKLISLPTFTIVLIFAAGLSSDCAHAELKSELENPFRFFKYPSDYAVQRIAFDLELVRLGTTDRHKVDILEIERKLNSSAFWAHPITSSERTLWPKSWNGNTPLEVIDGLRKIEGRKSIGEIVQSSGMSPSYVLERFGWASLLDTHLSPSLAAVCWNRASLEHDNCPDYVNPKSWRVRVFDDAEIPAVCKWELSGGAIFVGSNQRTKNAGCQEIYIEISAVKKATVGPAMPTGIAKVVRTDNQGAKSELTVSLKDRLIVGLGDSYSSGEGNPDRPVVLTSSVAAGEALLPRRPGENSIWAAHWIDRSCHRSVYSWQFRATI